MSTTQNTVLQGDRQPCIMGNEATGHGLEQSTLGDYRATLHGEWAMGKQVKQLTMTMTQGMGKQVKQLTMTVKHPTLPPRLEGEPWPARDSLPEFLLDSSRALLSLVTQTL